MTVLMTLGAGGFAYLVNEYDDVICEQFLRLCIQGGVEIEPRPRTNDKMRVVDLLIEYRQVQVDS